AISGGDSLANLRSACLNQNRPSLRRTPDRQGSTNGEVLSRVIEDMHLFLIEEHARLLIQHERVVVPAVPEAGHNIDELFRAFVALVVGEMLAAIEVPGFLIGPRRDDVPARTAAADLIKGTEYPPDV